MTSTMTAAQAAQQSNRDRGGRYAEMARDEVDLDLEPDVEDEQERPWTWRLSSYELEATRAKIAKINERATKRGFTGRFDLEVEQVSVPVRAPDGAEIGTEIRYETTIVGTPPAYGGWQFIAALDTVESNSGSGIVVRAAPGVEEGAIDREQLTASWCDHCQTHRRRGATFVVRHEDTGEMRQVGSTCIKDFTGWQGRPVFVSEKDLEGQVDDMLGQMGPTRGELVATPTLAVAIALVKARGYRRSGDEDSTASLVNDYLYGRSTFASDLRSSVTPACEEDVREMVEAICSSTDGGDYMDNLRTVLSSPIVNPRHLGILVSAVPAYERMMGRQAERAVREERPNAWIGSPGDKGVAVAGKVVVARTVDGYMPGTSSTLLVIDTPNGTAKTFTTAAWAWEVETGDDVSLTGTVKGHGEYEGRKETMMTRLKPTT